MRIGGVDFARTSAWAGENGRRHGAAEEAGGEAQVAEGTLGDAEGADAFGQFQQFAAAFVAVHPGDHAGGVEVGERGEEMEPVVALGDEAGGMTAARP